MYKSRKYLPHGYILGMLFGIKTEKAAGQVVVAMRDLFQVVFELKKKEIDEAKQNIDAGENESVSLQGKPHSCFVKI